MYELIITEKPQAAKKIAEALADGKPIKENIGQVPYYKLTYKNKDIVVACAVGHLYNLDQKEGKKWDFPVFDIEWQPVSETNKSAGFSKKYLNTIKKLAKEAKNFTVATDYDVEGEVIGLNVIRYACNQKDAARMKFSTLTKPDLVEAYEEKSKHLDWGQAYAGETRHFLDWYNGINYSRALTHAIKTTGSFKIMSTGRVQGPALKIIVDREKEIKAFKPVPFWQIELDGEANKGKIIAWHEQKVDEKKLKEFTDRIIIEFKNYNIDLNKDLMHLLETSTDIIKKAKIFIDWKDYFLEKLKENEKKDFENKLQKLKKLLDINKFWEKEKADLVFKKIKNEKNAIIDKVEKSQFNQAPPNPFDLTTLQVEAYRCHNLQPKDTLSIAQDLYTSGFISYPRTSSQQLSEKIGYKRIFNDLSKQKDYHELVSKLLAKKDLKPNNGKKEDPAHPAIYPTGIVPDIDGREKKIYDLIVRRFLATFADPAVRETMEITIDCKQELFIAKGTRTVEKGWHVFYGSYVKLEEIELPSVTKGDNVKVKKINFHEKETQPPKRYTPASIIRELEKRNLGTKSTRATIIDTLFQRGYVYGSAIEATTLGIKTIETLEKHCPEIIDEELTRHFEEEMEEIRTGKKKSEEILKEAKDYLIKIIGAFKKHEKHIGEDLKEAMYQSRDELSTLGKCPVCKEGSLLLRKGKFGSFSACNKFPECKTTFSLPSNTLIKPTKNSCSVCGYPMVLAIKKKSAREFCLNPDCKSKYVEGEAGKIAKQIAKGKIEKKCPKCNGNLILRSSIYGKFYGCSNYPKCKHIEKLEGNEKENNNKD